MKLENSRVKMFLACVGLSMCSVSGAESVSHTLSVDEAYRAIPHSRTTFRSEEARMGHSEATYLAQFFSLVDVAVVERVQTQISLQSARGNEPDRQNYAAILDKFSDLDVPRNLRDVHSTVKQAVEEQAEYLDAWRSNPKQRRFDARHPLVGSSHHKLLQAYYRLMALFPGEGAHNKNAFFSHLCALDFI